MFKNDKLFFCRDFEVKDAKTLYADFEKARKDNRSKAIETFQKICSVMKKRVDDNYISPIKTFLNTTKNNPDREGYGFIVMGINCILIEFYYEMINGYDQSSEGGEIVEAYKNILPLFDSKITADEAIKFYKGIRCGIIHQGQTKDETAITFEYEEIIKKNGPYYLCNPNILFNALKKQYKDYWDMLSTKSFDANESELMLKKYNLILRKISI